MPGCCERRLLPALLLFTMAYVLLLHYYTLGGGRGRLGGGRYLNVSLLTDRWYPRLKLNLRLHISLPTPAQHHHPQHHPHTTALCPLISPHIRERINMSDARLRPGSTPVTLTAVERALSSGGIAPGGGWSPRECRSRHARTTVVLIPYRDRADQLPRALRHLHGLLQRQQLQYRIYLIEQTSGSKFNRGKLLNVGFSQSFQELVQNDTAPRDGERRGPWPCYILQDVDYLAESDLTSYTCNDDHPQHLVRLSSAFNYKPIYYSFFGAVSAVTAEQFLLINGFSNKFWGWGGEDDDLYNRIKWKNMSMIRPGRSKKFSNVSSLVGRFFMMGHKKNPPSPARVGLVVRGKKRAATDGLNSLRYHLLHKEKLPLFTKLVANLTVETENDSNGANSSNVKSKGRTNQKNKI